MQAGVAFEVVPGVTSAVAAPAYAGVPVTHRGLVTAFTVVAGHTRSVDLGPAEGGTDWEALARGGGTIVVLMGAAHRGKIAERLMAGGLPPETPVAAVQWGTSPGQVTRRTTLGELGDGAAGATGDDGDRRSGRPEPQLVRRPASVRLHGGGRRVPSTRPRRSAGGCGTSEPRSWKSLSSGSGHPQTAERRCGPVSPGLPAALIRGSSSLPPTPCGGFSNSSPTRARSGPRRWRRSARLPPRRSGTTASSPTWSRTTTGPRA